MNNHKFELHSEETSNKTKQRVLLERYLSKKKYYWRDIGETDAPSKI
jgi:hypothetical protein